MLRHQRRVEPSILKRYRAAYLRHFELWKSAAVKHGVLLARIPAEPAFQQAMQAEAIPFGAVELAG